MVVPEPTSCAVKLYRLRIMDGVTPRCRPTVSAACGSGRCLKDDVGGKRCSPPTVERRLGLRRSFRLQPPLYCRSRQSPRMASKLLQPLALPAPTPPTPSGVTKVHMGGQGLRESVGTWGPYNMGLCRSPHIAVKLRPREQQLCLSGGQRAENRGQKAWNRADGCVSIARQLVVSPCVSSDP